MASDPKTDDKIGDDELNELLDSALEDLERKPEPKLAQEIVEGSDLNDAISEPNDDVFAAQLSMMMAKMSSVLGGDGQDMAAITRSLQEMGVTNAETDGATPAVNDITNTIADTLQKLSQNLENTGPSSEDDLLKMFGSLGAGSDGEGGVFLPMIQEMMSSLLSKDIIYPSIKDIVTKYPAWLDENKEKISPEEFERFTKQKEIMEEICTEFEVETDADPADVKKKRFEKVLELMRKMQDYGHPPEEIVDQSQPPIPLGEDGRPIVDVAELESMAQDKCLIM